MVLLDHSTHMHAAHTDGNVKKKSKEKNPCPLETVDYSMWNFSLLGPCWAPGFEGPTREPGEERIEKAEQIVEWVIL